MQVAFIKAYILLSRKLSNIFKFFPVFILALAVLETSYGETVEVNNSFEFKQKTAWKGSEIACSTHESIKYNVRHDLLELIRKYDSKYKGFQGFIMQIRPIFMQSNSVYDKSVCELIVADSNSRIADSPHYSKVLTAAYQNIREYRDVHPYI